MNLKLLPKPQRNHNPKVKQEVKPVVVVQVKLPPANPNHKLHLKPPAKPPVKLLLKPEVSQEHPLEVNPEPHEALAAAELKKPQEHLELASQLHHDQNSQMARFPERQRRAMLVSNVLSINILIIQFILSTKIFKLLLLSLNVNNVEFRICCWHSKDGRKQ